MQGPDMSAVPWRFRAYPQVIIVGCICFCCPGMFNALQGLGNAGGDDPSVSSMMNAVLYACFAIFGFFGGFFFNTFGNRALLGGGGLTYALYAIGVYLWGSSASWAWFAITASGLLGAGAGFLWTAQGAMTMAYPTEAVKGKYAATFWIIFNLGGMMGGLLAMVLNWSESGSSKVNAASYFTFTAIMVVGALLSFVALVPPSKVVREDGKPIIFEKSPGPAYEFKSVIALFCNKSMLMMIPLTIQSNWFYSYEFGGYNGLLFNARTRGFNSAMYWGAQMLGAFIVGKICDNPSMTRKRRAVVALTIIAIVNSAQWVWAVFMGFTFEGGYDNCEGCKPEDGEKGLIDITDGGRFILPFALFVFMGVCDSMVQNYAYWLMGALANTPDECARYAGFYKGIQSFGACIAWIIDSQGVSYKVQLMICVAWSVAFIPPSYLVASWINETNEEVVEEAVEYAEEAVEQKEAGVYFEAPPVVASDFPTSMPVANNTPVYYQG